jgi:hypothetical protein
MKVQQEPPLFFPAMVQAVEISRKNISPQVWDSCAKQCNASFRCSYAATAAWRLTIVSCRRGCGISNSTVRILAAKLVNAQLRRDTIKPSSWMDYSCYRSTKIFGNQPWQHCCLRLAPVAIGMALNGARRARATPRSDSGGAFFLICANGAARGLTYAGARG